MPLRYCPHPGPFLLVPVSVTPDDRGPGPLSSDVIWKFNSKFIEFSPAIEATRRSCTPGGQICITQSSIDTRSGGGRKGLVCGEVIRCLTKQV